MSNRRVPAAVRRMSGEDSGFLALDLPGQPMTILYMLVLGRGAHAVAEDRQADAAQADAAQADAAQADAAQADAAQADAAPLLTVEDLRAHLDKRLDHLTSLRWRILAVPGRVHHPLWVDDATFDLSNHVSAVDLAPPGDSAVLATAYARLIAEPLERTRPPWDVTLFNGLASGRQAIVWRYHHCLMDGLASLRTLACFFADETELATLEPTAFSPGEPPERRSLLRAAFRDQLANARRLPSLLGSTRRALKAQEAFRSASPVTLPKPPKDVPDCSLNAFGPRRSFSMTELDLADLRLIREVAGVSYTDVTLAAVAGGLRSVLHAAGGLPGRSLIAECPIAFEESVPGRQWGNKFTNIVTSLATDIEDPWARLAAISNVTAAARRCFDTFGEELWDAWLDTIPPLVTVPTMRRHYRHRRTRREANANVVVTSVRGPSRPWRIGDLEVEEVWGAGPPANGVGLLLAFISYAGRVFVGVNSVELSLPEPAHFTASITLAVSELAREAASRRPASFAG